MKTVLIPLILVMLMNPAASADTEADATSLKTAVQLFGLSYKTAHVAVLDKMLTTDYIHINGGSGHVIDRKAWLNWVKSQHAEIKKGHLVIDEYEIKDYKQRIYGTTAFVTGVVETSGHKAGEPFASKIRFSNVWVKQDGHWLRAAFHDSPIK